MTHQALPDTEDWWNRIRASQEAYQEIGMLPVLFRLQQQGIRFPGSDAPIAKEAKALAAAFPGIERRSVSLDRAWDKLHYLLSPKRQAESGSVRAVEDDPGTIAIRGHRQLEQHITGTQGIAVRYTDTEMVPLAREFLDAIDEAELRAYFDPLRMYEAGVYKMSVSDNEAEFATLLKSLHGLQQFYAKIHASSEGVLVVID